MPTVVHTVKREHIVHTVRLFTVVPINTDKSVKTFIKICAYYDIC